MSSHPRLSVLIVAGSELRAAGAERGRHGNDMASALHRRHTLGISIAGWPRLRGTPLRSTGEYSVLCCTLDTGAVQKEGRVERAGSVTYLFSGRYRQCCA